MMMLVSMPMFVSDRLHLAHSGSFLRGKLVPQLKNAIALISVFTVVLKYFQTIQMCCANF